MRTKKVEKRIILKKTTVSDLSPNELNTQRGGAATDWCSVNTPRCQSIYLCTVTC